ncbi:MAG: TlpA family protein disulfide reductase [Gammaproteobacteria bacterium]|nr:TlpA family protein disulfide reductase [Gammaproteobacteria bacterium]
MLLFVCTLLFVAPTYAQDIAGPAPDFSLKSRSGDNLKLSEFRGEVVMLNFWASWCGPCRQEMPLLEALYKRYQPMGFTLLGVNVEENPEAALAMLEDIPVSFPILFDNENRVSELYDLITMPTTVLIDRDGNKRYLHRSFVPGMEKDYERQIKTLIRE